MDDTPQLAVYYEGGTVDRHWLAPAGLTLTEAKRQRVGKRYKTRSGAKLALDLFGYARAAEERERRKSA